MGGASISRHFVVFDVAITVSIPKIEHPHFEFELVTSNASHESKLHFDGKKREPSRNKKNQVQENIRQPNHLLVVKSKNTKRHKKRL